VGVAATIPGNKISDIGRSISINKFDLLHICFDSEILVSSGAEPTAFGDLDDSMPADEISQSEFQFSLFRSRLSRIRF
jgi:hypothetical protein